LQQGEVGDTDVQPLALAVDPSGKFLYCMNFGSPAGNGTIDLFSIDLSTGFLTHVDRTVTATDPGGLLVVGQPQ